jgi:hypothetical protein
MTKDQLKLVEIALDCLEKLNNEIPKEDEKNNGGEIWDAYAALMFTYENQYEE